MKRNHYLASLVLASAGVPSVVAAPLVGFNFDDMDTNNNGTTAVTFDAVDGTPTLDLFEDAGALDDSNGTSDYQGVVGGASAKWGPGLTAEGGGEDGFEINFDGTGFKDFELTFQYRSTLADFNNSASGSTQVSISWALGDDVFTEVEVFDFTVDNSYNLATIDLSGVTGLNSAPAIQIRGVFSEDAEIGDTLSPSLRIDALEVSGVVPEPASAALLGIGSLFMCSTLRRR